MITDNILTKKEEIIFTWLWRKCILKKNLKKKNVDRGKREITRAVFQFCLNVNQ